MTNIVLLLWIVPLSLIGIAISFLARRIANGSLDQGMKILAVLIWAIGFAPVMIAESALHVGSNNIGLIPLIALGVGLAILVR